MSRPLVVALLVVALLAVGCGVPRPAPAVPDPGSGQGAAGAPITGAQALRQLRYPTLQFDEPEPERFELSNGVTVFFLADPTLPLVDVFVDVRGGYAYFGRDHYAAGAALVSLMRNGGAGDLTPDSLDALVEYHALAINTYSDGGRLVVGTRALHRHRDLALGIWSDILLRPRFAPEAVERWRIREVNAVRHLGDFPGSLAVLEFNRLLYGDHPMGWMLTEADLSPERVTPERLREMHRRVVCPEHAVIGAAGQMTRAELEAALERALAGWRPCGEALPPPVPPVVRADASVYIIPKCLGQSTIVVGQPGGVLLDDTPEYFASRVANWVIGGSGATSRLDARIRGEEGLAYSAASIWGVARDHERIFGAITHTAPERTVEAARLVLATLDDAVANPPRADEVTLARESIVNGFVFGFGSAAQIVARRVSHHADDLPADWLARYLDGIRRVDAPQVARVLRDRVRPRGYTILIVGDTTAFDPAALGPYTVLPGS